MHFNAVLTIIDHHISLCVLSSISSSTLLPDTWTPDTWLPEEDPGPVSCLHKVDVMMYIVFIIMCTIIKYY